MNIKIKHFFVGLGIMVGLIGLCIGGGVVIFNITPLSFVDSCIISPFVFLFIYSVSMFGKSVLER